MGQWFGAGRGRLGLYALGVVMLVVGVIGMAAGTGMFSGVGADPSERAIQPVGAEKSTPHGCPTGAGQIFHD